VETVDADHVRLRCGDQSQAVLLRRLSVLTPSRVPEALGEPGLLVAPRATRRAVGVAVGRGWGVATDDGQYAVKVGRRSLLSQPMAKERARRHPGPPSWGLLTVARRLLELAPATGLELAAASGVSQSRVSRVLAKLSARALVERGSEGYRPVDRRRLVDWWLANYPGAGGAVSYWACADSVAEQTREAVSALAAAGRVAVSGDPAADRLAPWRIPTFAVVYAERGVPLDNCGFVLVASREEATLALCAPADPGLWLPSDWTVNGIPLADPLQIVYDVANGPEPDRAEAATRLDEALLSRYRTQWENAARKDHP
jgi:hypothetical protein